VRADVQRMGLGIPPASALLRAHALEVQCVGLHYAFTEYFRILRRKAELGDDNPPPEALDAGEEDCTCFCCCCGQQHSRELTPSVPLVARTRSDIKKYARLFETYADPFNKPTPRLWLPCCLLDDVRVNRHPTFWH